MPYGVLCTIFVTVSRLKCPYSWLARALARFRAAELCVVYLVAQLIPNATSTDGLAWWLVVGSWFIRYLRQKRGDLCACLNVETLHGRDLSLGNHTFQKSLLVTTHSPLRKAVQG